MTDGHGHGHSSVRASPRVRAVLTLLLVPALLATIAGLWWLWPSRGDLPVVQTTPTGTSFERVTVTSVVPSADAGVQVLATRAGGDEVGIQVPPEYVPEIEPGDRLTVLYLAEAIAGGSPYVFVDFVRGPPIAALTAVFALLVLLVARWRGLAALVGLAVSLGGIGVFTLPALLEGRPAGAVALVTASALMFVVLYLAHGFSARTSTALLGTLGGLVATTAIAAWAGGAAHLTGLSGENALDLRQLAPDMSLRGVLLCGMVLAGLGVLNDVTITQASAVWELRGSTPGASRTELFRRGMRIGRDHIASTVYTVAFAYVGAALPLVLLISLSDRTLLDTLTSGEIAEEVVRTLVGSIGLVLAIPLTTAVAALVVTSGGRATAAGSRSTDADADADGDGDDAGDGDAADAGDGDPGAVVVADARSGSAAVAGVVPPTAITTGPARPVVSGGAQPPAPPGADRPPPGPR